MDEHRSVSPTPSIIEAHVTTHHQGSTGFMAMLPYNQEPLHWTLKLQVVASYLATGAADRRDVKGLTDGSNRSSDRPPVAGRKQRVVNG